MYEYLIFVLFGIILFILLNSNDRFSVGVPEYKFTLVSDVVDQIEQTYESGVLAVESDPVYQDHDNPDIFYVYGENEGDAINNFDTYMQSRSGGGESLSEGIPPESSGGGGACSVVSGGDTTIDRYIVEAQRSGVIIQLDGETIEYLKSNTAWLRDRWTSKDPEFMEIIYDLESKGLTDNKNMICVGESFFIYLSCFFSNSRFIFVDINLVLLTQMKLCIDKLKSEIDEQDDYSTVTEKINRISEEYGFGNDSIDDFRNSPIYTEENVMKLQTNLSNNSFEFYASSITSNLFIDFITPFIMSINYINISNLIIHHFGNKIPNFWKGLGTIKRLNPDILYIGTKAPPRSGFVFQYDEEIQHDDSILNFMGPHRDDYGKRIIPMLQSKQWIRYLIINFNSMYFYERGGELVLDDGTFGNKAIIDRL